MARMYSRKRGKSGSKKPLKPIKHVWISYTPDEIEQLVVKLAKSEKSSSQIGVILRDKYGIPDVRRLLKKRVTKILMEKGLLGDLPEDLVALIKKEMSITKHLEGNKHDEVGKRGLLLTESKIRRLVKYYKENGRLSADWKYDKKMAKLLVSI